VCSFRRGRADSVVAGFIAPALEERDLALSGSVSPKRELRQANIDSRFARNARVIADDDDPFNTPRQAVVRELIYCINRVRSANP
jgi:hypothetical protein